jgi:hypothetical protein
LKIKNWTNCIQDRNNWKLNVEKAKTFKDWSCSAWRRRRIMGANTIKFGVHMNHFFWSETIKLLKYGIQFSLIYFTFIYYIVTKY